MSKDRRTLRLCFIANAHSVHVRRFLAYFVRRGHEVTLVTPELCLYEIPGVKVVNVRGLSKSEKMRRALREIRFLHHLRDWKNRAAVEFRHATLSHGSLVERAAETIRRSDEEERERWNTAARQVAPVLNKIISAAKPDIIQSLRFYPEGLMAASVDHPCQCFFVWGSDLSGYATWYPEVADMTRSAMKRCAGLLHDNMKDYRCSGEFGLPQGVPHLLVPSNGGIDTSVAPPASPPCRDGIPQFATIRRMGNLFMNNETVLRGMALLHARGLRVTYSVYGREVGPYYDRLRVLAQELGIWKSIHFEQPYAANEVYEVIRRCRYQVSPAIDDGTSAALLETMWCGAVPIYSNVESIREWITDGKNGYLFDMDDPSTIAERMQRAWQEEDGASELIECNRELVRQRADYTTSMTKVLEFYYSLIGD